MGLATRPCLPKQPPHTLTAADVNPTQGCSAAQLFVGRGWGGGIPRLEEWKRFFQNAPDKAAQQAPPDKQAPSLLVCHI